MLTVGLALLLAFDPNLIFQWTGLVLGDAGTLLGRILGLVYLGIAIELWFVRGNSDLPARSALLRPQSTVPSWPCWSRCNRPG
ncbi:hypothetical protein P4200_22640 [Pseudomonas aeruginosa]|nr:hypothetical protein [Pseudomonas aeruginosa]